MYIPFYVEKVKMVYELFDEFDRDEYFPGGVEQAERLIRCYLYLLGKDADYLSLMEFYLYTVKRIRILNWDNEQIKRSFGRRYRRTVPKDKLDMAVRFTRAFHNDYLTAGMKTGTRDKADAMRLIMELLMGEDRLEDCPMDDALEKPGFGTDVNNPIFTTGVADSYEYLNHLYTPDGVPLVWLRLDSVMTEFYANPVDHYVLCRPDGKGYMKIFVYMYSKETSSYCPRGTVSSRDRSLPEEG